MTASCLSTTVGGTGLLICLSAVHLRCVNGSIFQWTTSSFGSQERAGPQFWDGGAIHLASPISGAAKRKLELSLN